ncbi:MAG TPA: LTA synthase family protein [Candidatus Ruthenibacterium avium]|uniref:LTA synthase family protein n=1 Tax=Candidatus Ruthenibacterium avium TaxID=2838751 RepID=A0A9D2M4P3_9FIRM|nr:LTA synthase family protein [Candidatus Ruthenibacterium avium]
MKGLTAVQERITEKTSRYAWLFNLAAGLLFPSILFWGMEWLHRGTLFSDEFWNERLLPHPEAFILAWLFVLGVYTVISQIFGRHWPAVLILGIIAYGAGTVTYFKLEMRGEPLLPWDFQQLGDFMGVADNVKLSVQPHMIVVALIFLLCLGLSIMMPAPYRGMKRRGLIVRLILAIVGAVMSLGIFFGIYMSKEVCASFHIYEDMWMQDRYYRNYSIVTGFLTNLRVMQFEAPENYSQEAVYERLDQVEKDLSNEPLYEDSYAAEHEKDAVQTPNIIYVMNESFWDVSRLEGIAFDRDLTSNLKRLAQQGASGYVYSPSFGGGTCDVEFEVLTGFSLEHLPAGSKPYQQYVTDATPSVAQFLKGQGYSTVAIHGYYERMWSRNTAYPRLGLDDFISIEDMSDPDKRRGFVSDMEMTQQIIEQYESRKENGPVFIHAVTMQNHTTYDESKYPQDELVNVLEHPGLSEKTLSPLRDFATGVYEADAALGALTDYFSQVEEPTIIVFWGDHFNPFGDGYEIYEKTGYIEKGDTSSPALHQTDLLIWSNYSDTHTDLGTIAAYEVSPVMAELYGLERPIYFDYLLQQMSVYRARTRGVTVEANGSFSETMTEEQQQWYNDHWLLQYDQMFGKNFTAQWENET